MWFGLPWIISFHYEPPVGRAQAVTPQVLLKNTRLVSLLDTAGISSSSPSSSDLELGTSFQTLLNEFLTASKLARSGPTSHYLLGTFDKSYELGRTARILSYV